MENERKGMTYKTNSMQLASYLYSKPGIKFEGLNKDNPSSVSFLFSPYDLAEKCTEEYFSGRATANPLELFSNNKILKDMVFEIKRNESNN